MHKGTATTDVGLRFEFGKNWALFLKSMNDDRLELAMKSLQTMLDRETLQGLRFLDVGSGSGLFSLAARKLGATVHSFDYDPDSVECTRALRARYRLDDANWIVERGDALDAAYLGKLGRFDVVYSWGVLHHTGRMWKALGNMVPLVDDDGQLFLAIYNDQGRTSRLWFHIKRVYNALPGPLRWLILIPALLRLWGPTSIRDLLQLRPFRTWRNYTRKSLRGMSPWRDVVDWVGGYPFEVAKPEEVFAFFSEKGFALQRLKTCGGGLGCNEFVFRKTIQAGQR